MKAIANEEQGKALTDMDYKFFFYPWYAEPTYTIESDEPIRQETKQYFEKLYGDMWFHKNYGIALTD